MATPEVPLEHAHETIEHHAHGSSEPWVMGVALTASVLAALAAVTALCAEHFANEAMLERIEATDKWNESQADSIKEKLLDTKKAVKDLDPEEEKKLREYPTKKEENRAEGQETAGAVRRPCTKAFTTLGGSDHVSSRHRHWSDFRSDQAPRVLVRSPHVWGHWRWIPDLGAGCVSPFLANLGYLHILGNDERRGRG